MAYVYAPDCKAGRPIAHPADFHGVLQVDGYADCRALADQGQVRLAFCFSHVRRRFYELAAAGPAPIATEALKGSGELYYTVETDIGGLAAEERRSERQACSPP